MKEYQPYTYLIGWSQYNKWYYGVQYKKNCNPIDLWVSYFTSSKYVKEFREQYGNPDIIEVRKTFNTREKAILWEQKVLLRMNVRKRDDFLNVTDNKIFAVIHHSEETKRKWSIKRKGVPSWNKGIKTGPQSEETKKLKSLKFKGIPHPNAIGRVVWNKGIKTGVVPSKENLRKRSENNMKPMIFDGILYSSRKECSEKTGITKSMLNYNMNKGRGHYIEKEIING